MGNESLTNENAEFWDELCGTGLAKHLGVTDSSAESLEKYDNFYFEIYPYLNDYINTSDLKGKDILEIGLGYGTVSSHLAKSGSNYSGLDIASGPVKMVNHRLELLSVSGKAVIGSILEPPFEEESFDTIVAIGSLHHTGDLQLAIDSCYKLLRPEGELIFMVYNAYSYRRFVKAFIKTVLYFIREQFFFYRGVIGSSSTKERAAYDANTVSLVGAPHTDWISIRSLKKLCQNFSHSSANLENIDQESPFKRSSRKELLLTRWPSWFGLDIYVVAKK